MKLMTRAAPLAAVTLLLAGVAGCAGTPARSGDHSHASTASMDMQSHCEMHRKKMAGKPAAEQQAMMQEHMKSMAADMRQKMQAMHEQCK